MRILLIDDYKTISQIIGSSLEAYGFTLRKISSDMVDAKNIKKNKYNLIIINTNLATRDAFSLVKGLRNHHVWSYIIGITSVTKWKHTVRFLNAGADDIIKFPFPFQELLARIQALQRRPKLTAKEVIDFDGYKLDLVQRELKYDGKPIPLRRKEFQILEYMVRNKNRPISRSELMDNVWDYSRIISSNTIDVHVNNIRQRLKDVRKGENIDSIKTVHGFGYMFHEPTPKYNKKKSTKKAK